MSTASESVSLLLYLHNMQEHLNNNYDVTGVNCDITDVRRLLLCYF